MDQREIREQIKSLLTRNLYRDAKRYSRVQMEEFLANLYLEGYRQGFSESKVDKVVEVVDMDGIEQGIKELLRVNFKIGEIRYTNANMRDKVLNIVDKNMSKVGVQDAQMRFFIGERDMISRPHNNILPSFAGGVK